VNVIPVKSGVRAVVGEFNLKFQLIPLDLFATDRAKLTYPGSAPSTVGEAGGHPSRTERFSGFFSDDEFVGHDGSPGFKGSASCQMPEGRTPVSRHPEPDGRQLLGYTFKDRRIRV
jgi:hypothetical protein